MGKTESGVLVSRTQSHREKDPNRNFYPGTMTKLSDLGDGAKRFAPQNERSLEEQIAALNEGERKCFDTPKTEWKSYVESAKKGKEDLPSFDDGMILRFATNSPGKTKFNPSTRSEDTGGRPCDFLHAPLQILSE